MLFLAGAAGPPAVAAEPADEVLSWGAGSSEKLGDDDAGAADRDLPGDVQLPTGVSVTDVEGGDDHTLAVTSDGRVLAWGGNGAGQLGDGTNESSSVPVDVALPEDAEVLAVSAGYGFSLALTVDGRVLAWGRNDAGQLGDGSREASDVPVAVALPGGARAASASAGEAFSVVSTSDGSVLAWGDNSDGQLGSGNRVPSAVPVRAALPAGAVARTAAAGAQHGMAVTSSGRLLTWGANSQGQLGDGTFTDRTSPVSANLPGDAVVDEVVSDNDHNLAITPDGGLYTWGGNDRGQLGDGTANDRSSPVPVALPGDGAVVDVAAGEFHSLALDDLGRVFAWGSDAAGQLGIGGGADQRTAVQAEVPADRAATGVGAGQARSAALVRPRSSATNLTAEPAVVHRGVPVALTATVTCSAGEPTGTVSFTDGDREIGTATVGEDGAATLTTDQPDTGEHAITAHYSGTDTCPPSSSEPVTVRMTEQSAPPPPPGPEPPPQPQGGLAATGPGPLPVLLLTGGGATAAGAAMLLVRRGE
nr:Ig-like domain repeat protein [Saccharopolyspora sp. HNM0983]